MGCAASRTRPAPDAPAAAAAAEDEKALLRTLSRRREYEIGSLRGAAARGDLPRARALLEQGVDPNSQAEKLGSFGPLHYAKVRGHHAIVELLLEAGAVEKEPWSKAAEH